MAHKQKRYSALIDPPEVLVHCKLTQVHMPRTWFFDRKRYSFWSYLPAAIAARGIWNSYIDFPLGLAGRAASRRAPPCPSSCKFSADCNGEGISKIGQYLMKLCLKYSRLFFSGHGVHGGAALRSGCWRPSLAIIPSVARQSRRATHPAP